MSGPQATSAIAAVSRSVAHAGLAAPGRRQRPSRRNAVGDDPVQRLTARCSVRTSVNPHSRATSRMARDECEMSDSARARQNLADAIETVQEGFALREAEVNNTVWQQRQIELSQIKCHKT